jgi:hypothetical protein
MAEANVRYCAKHQIAALRARGGDVVVHDRYGTADGRRGIDRSDLGPQQDR